MKKYSDLPSASSGVYKTFKGLRKGTQSRMLRSAHKLEQVVWSGQWFDGSLSRFWFCKPSGEVLLLLLPGSFFPFS